MISAECNSELQVMVDAVFVAVLDRSPDPSELSEWCRVLTSVEGNPGIVLTRSLQSTAEYQQFDLARRDASPAYWRLCYELLFQALLGRGPRENEISLWNGTGNPLIDPFDLMHALRRTEEYRDQLVLNSSIEMRRMPEEGLFFLHVPKCGGTSIAAAVSSSVGIRALKLTPTESNGLGALLPTLGTTHSDRWPFQTGHLSIDCFPESFRGFSVVREPRVRLLSLFRFISSPTFELQTQMDGNHGMAQISRTWRNTGPSILANSDVNSELPQVTGFAWMFAAGLPSQGLFESATAEQRMSALERGLDRLEGLAWIHDTQGLHTLIHTLVGGDVRVGRENVTQDIADASVTLIDNEFLAELDRLVVWDRILLRMAMDRGLLAEFGDDESDALLHASLGKLGFAID